MSIQLPPTQHHVELCMREHDVCVTLSHRTWGLLITVISLPGHMHPDSLRFHLDFSYQSQSLPSAFSQFIYERFSKNVGP